MRDGKTFVSDSPCSKGHGFVRYLSSHGCYECARLSREANREKNREYSREWRKANPEQARFLSKKWKHANPERTKEINKQSLLRNLERRRDYEREYRIAHRHACAAASRAWARKNSDHVAQKARECKARNPEAYKAIVRRFLERHKERLNEISRQRYAANPEMHRAKNRAWFKVNSEYSRAKCAKRRARERQAEGAHTHHDIRRLFGAQKGRCAYCRTSLRSQYHVDHILPLILGGANWPENLQLLCPDCNQRKGGLHPVEFARRIGLLV